MKHRAISFITVLALCLSLCPVRALAADAEDPGRSERHPVERNTTTTKTYDVTGSWELDTCGYTYTVTGATAVSVKSTGRLYLTTGKIESTGGAGIEVLKGGFLCVDQAGMTVIGTTYGLDIASGATAQLSGGTFTGKTAAIRAADGDYGALLKTGYAYFDESGSTLLPEKAAGVKTITVKECTNHVLDDYTAADGEPAHSWTCLACGSTGTEYCTFDFVESLGGGYAECADCGHTITVTVNEPSGDLVYNGDAQPDSVSVTVMLDGREKLSEGTDYTVVKTTGTNVGELIAVTVSGRQPYKWSFTRKYSITQATPVIAWGSAATPNKDYDGEPIDEAALLQKVVITAPDADELKKLVYFTYKKTGSSDYTRDVPTDAGTYQIKANLPETDNYYAASTSGTIVLTISPIGPIKADPAANSLTYNGTAQKLVTSGTLDPRAAGAKILFALGENVTDSDFSEAIPTATDAGDYVVWYKVEGTNNYNSVTKTKLEVTIARKEITPTVELEYYTCVYDGGFKEPKVTVKDGETVLPASEYKVNYWDNQAVGTAKVIVSDEAGGNYAIEPSDGSGFTPPAELGVTEGVIVTFQITPADQAALTITGQPNEVVYGDVFTLGTVGGSGNGTITWTIVSGTAASIEQNSGKVTVTGVGEVTVRATKSGTNNDGNHVDATAEWTFTAGKRPVTAKVTADDKVYNGNANAAVHAVVEQGLVSGDTITITVTGAFSDADAGTNKTVNVDIAQAIIIGGENYIVTIPKTTTANITKAEARIRTAPTLPEELIYSGEKQALFAEGATPNNASIQVEYALSKDGTYSTAIPEATNAGRYEVWYRVQESTNYTGIPAAMVEVTISPKTLGDSAIVLDGDSYEYDGSEKRPAVTVKDGENVIIPVSEYTVTYSNNVNAGTATVTVTDNAGGNYTVNGTANFTIAKATAKLTEPQARTLTYNGSLQNLVTPGAATGGQLVYALKETEDDKPADDEYAPTIPQGKDAGTYYVYYKVVGDSNHNSIDADKVTVSIAKNTVNTPNIILSSNTFRYNGSQQIPTITVRDDKGLLIAEHEYVVTISGKNADEEDIGGDSVDVGTYTITITPSENSNYVIKSDNDETTGRPRNTKTYSIVPADQETITITGTRDQVYYGDKIQLDIEGGTGNGTVTWEVTSNISDPTNTPHNEISEGGQLTIREVGTFTVTATRTSSDNYDTATKTWEFYAGPKPVTAVLTGENKTYDGSTTVKVKAKVAPGDLVGEDWVSEWSFIENFEDANVGTNKRIIITASSPIKVGNYVVTYPNTATADITPKQITPTVTVAAGPFTYNGTAIEPGVTVTDTDDTLQLGVDYTVEYSNNINAGTATVTVKNVPGGNYRIYKTETFTIDKATPTVSAPVGRTELTYTGAAQELIYRGSTSGGTMVYSLNGENYSEDIPTGTAAGEYTVYYKVLGNNNYNGDDNASYTITVEIGKAEQSSLTITEKPSLVHYGDLFTLSVAGGSGDGAISWSTNNNGIAEINPSSGLVKVTGVGNVTITVTKAGSNNYNDISATWTFTAVQAAAAWATEPEDKISLIYNPGEPLITAVTTVNGVGKVEYSLDKVRWQDTVPTVEKAGTYTVWYKVEGNNNYTGLEPKSVEVTIAPKEVTVTVKLNGDGGSGATPGLVVTYTDSDGATKTIDSSEYTVTVKPENWTDLRDSGKSFTVTVKAKEGGNYKFDTVTKMFAVAGANVPVGGGSGGSSGSSTGTGGGSSSGGGTGGTSSSAPSTSTPSAQEPEKSEESAAPEEPDEQDTPDETVPSVQTSVRDGAASTVVNGAAVVELVDEAVANQSGKIVIKPEITGDVTKTEVSIPASAVSRIGGETDAALTVSTPVADVTIPNGALEALSGAGDTVSVATERVENTVVLTLSADGEAIGDIPGGLTLSVAVEDAGPGTVAVLVREDGTRETIRWSVAEDGVVRIPLDGSATVEIVDNSKEFSDVSEENWAAGAVAFASAHELFNGTSETTFSPNMLMSRGMLATVLYNLDGKPELEQTGGFSDVDSDVWYAAGISWAAANGIVNGYGNGRFGPDDNMTREQLAIMLWRYMGSPAAEVQTLDFTDADRVSGYAVEALCWAVENGVLNGYGNGYLDPGGLATRAQAAQMLKNFIENA